MTWWQRMSWLGVAGLAVVGLCCSARQKIGESAFETFWRDDQGESITALQQRLSGVALAPPSAVAVGVTGEGLTAISLDSRTHWQSAGPVQGRPVVAGNLVIATTGDQLVALDAASGQRRWSIPTEGTRLRGAGSDGQLTALSLAVGSGSVLLAVDSAGQVLQRIDTEHALGVPAVKGGVAFVPFQNQYVSAVDLRSGDELARLLMRERVTQAVNIDGGLYFGQMGLVRFDEQIGKASVNQATRVGLPGRQLPGSPVWLTNGAQVPPTGASAYDRIRVYARPAIIGDALGIDSGRFVATYFHVVMGFDSTDASLHWVRTLPEEVLGGAAAEGGFAVCDRNGHVWLLAAQTGGKADKLSLGKKLIACVVSAGDLVVPAAPGSGKFAEQLGVALKLDDTRMDAAQQFLLQEVARLREPIATKILVDVASNPRTSESLLGPTRRLLAQRRSGATYMLQALQRHYDFLSDVLRPPPVGPLADALSAMGERRAAPLLARHLNDPANTMDDVKRTARALVKLATSSEYEQLLTFFSLYRATADSDELLDATIDVARAMMDVGGVEGRGVVQRASTDPLTRPEVRKAIIDELGQRRRTRKG
jgi:outer membrane protein assembly factor BamB